MGWNDNVNRNAADEMEDMAHPPSGGRVKMIVWGVVVPLLILYFAAEAWMDQEAIWFGSRTGGNMKVTGTAARGMAACYAGGAMFLHSRYFWGLWPVCRVFSIGVCLAIILGLGGCGTACYHVVSGLIG